MKKPFSKQKDGRFGLKWCCVQLLKPIPRQTDGHCCFKRCYMRWKNILSFIRTYQRCMQNIKVLSQDMWKVIRILNSPWIKNCWEVRQFLTEQKASKLNNNAKILFLNSIKSIELAINMPFFVLDDHIRIKSIDILAKIQ